MGSATIFPEMMVCSLFWHKIRILGMVSKSRPFGFLENRHLTMMFAMMQRYSHVAPEQLQNAVKLLDGVICKRQDLIGQVFL
jgi:hypothetical protein